MYACSHGDGDSCEEYPCPSKLFSIINLFPVGKSSRVTLVTSSVRGALEVVEHHVHALRRYNYCG